MRHWLLLLLTWAALSHRAPAQPRPTTLRGRLLTLAAGDSLQVTYHTTTAQGLDTRAAVANATGTFVLSLPAFKGPSYVYLNYGDRSLSLYLTPGDELTLQQPAPPPQPIHFTGRGANVNNYLAQAAYQFEQSPPGTGSHPQASLTAATTPAQARQQADAQRRARQTFLAAYATAHPLPPAFRQGAAEHIDLQWVLSLLAYPTKYQQLAYRPPVLPPTYYQFLTQLPPLLLAPPGRQIRARSSTDNSLVLNCLSFYGTRLLPSGQLSTDPAEGRRLCAIAAAELPHAAARDQALFLLLSQQAQTNLPGAVAAYPAFRAQSADSTLTRKLEHLLAQRQHALTVVPGQHLALTLPNEQGQLVSLSDFKGKVVYLDFWGTWCAPCRAEMPASNALKQQFAGRDVVFIYVSVGDTDAQWQQGIAALQLTGPSSVHLRAPTRAISDSFGVIGYPAYLVIGRDGRLRLPVAPRPSSNAEITAVLEQALTE